jgi:hypothetical protein
MYHCTKGPVLSHFINIRVLLRYENDTRNWYKVGLLSVLSKRCCMLDETMSSGKHTQINIHNEEYVGQTQRYSLINQFLVET